MAYTTSNSSYCSAMSHNAKGFETLWNLTNYLERWVEANKNKGATSSVNSDSGYASGTSIDQVSIVNSTSSQVTVTAPSINNSLSKRFEGLQVPTGPLGPVKMNYGSLEKDIEGIETKQQMLKRRRQECAAEDVDVALAPVLKIQVPYVFYPEQYKAFRKLFPRVNVDSGLHYTHHDHPVAHTATMVGIRKMQSMLQSGELALDLHGNPNGNEQFNRFQASRLLKRPGLPNPPKIETLVEERTAADAVRKITKWGDQYTAGVKRYDIGGLDDITPGKYKTFLSAHTLYYYSMYEISKLMNKNPGSKIIALVNYAKEQSGTLYGELRYSKQGGITTQVSPNGEAYQHPDIDAWFQSNSFRGLTETIDSGISWTSTCIAGPLYIITIVNCDWSVARHKRYDPPSAPVLKVSEDRSILLGMVRFNGADVRLRISNPDLASELRHFMTFRDRSNPQTFLDLCTKARRATGVDLVEGSRQYNVPDGELQDHIVYAYLVDAPGELELMEGVKLLRGDLLSPLADALKLEGDCKKISWSEALLPAIFGRETAKQSLGVRVKPKGNSIFHKEPNTGGLLPTKRT